MFGFRSNWREISLDAFLIEYNILPKERLVIRNRHEVGSVRLKDSVENTPTHSKFFTWLLPCVFYSQVSRSQLPIFIVFDRVLFVVELDNDDINWSETNNNKDNFDFTWRNVLYSNFTRICCDNAETVLYFICIGDSREFWKPEITMTDNGGHYTIQSQKLFSIREATDGWIFSLCGIGTNSLDELLDEWISRWKWKSTENGELIRMRKE